MHIIVDVYACIVKAGRGRSTNLALYPCEEEEMMPEREEAMPLSEAYPNPQERQALLDLLSTSGAEILTALDVHIHHQPPVAKPAGTWSPAQIAQHVMLTDLSIMSSVKKALALPVREDWKMATAGKAEILHQRLLLGLGKAVAPEALTPTENIDLHEVVERFIKHRRELLEFFVEQLSEARRCLMHAHIVPSVRFGEISAYQWGLGIGYHTLRHVRQVQRLADEG
jgi:hypothetical protein